MWPFKKTEKKPFLTAPYIGLIPERKVIHLIYLDIKPANKKLITRKVLGVSVEEAIKNLESYDWREL